MIVNLIQTISTQRLSFLTVFASIETSCSFVPATTVNLDTDCNVSTVCRLAFPTMRQRHGYLNFQISLVKKANGKHLQTYLNVILHIRNGYAVHKCIISIVDFL